MTIKTEVLAVNGSATPIVVSDTDGQYGQGISLLNVGAVTIWVGGVDVTGGSGGNGRPIEPGQPFDFDILGRTDLPYVVTAGSTGSLSVFRVGV